MVLGGKRNENGRVAREVASLFGQLIVQKGKQVSRHRKGFAGSLRGLTSHRLLSARKLARRKKRVEPCRATANKRRDKGARDPRNASLFACLLLFFLSCQDAELEAALFTLRVKKLADGSRIT